MRNHLGEPQQSYAPPANKSDCTKVTASGRKLTFAISGEPVPVTPEGERMTATAAGQFVRDWVRVK